MYAAGNSAETAGSTDIWLGLISLAAGKRTSAHFHEAHGTALYMLSGGEVEVFSGSELEDRQRVRPGDYLFIPAGVSHVAVNRSDVAAVFLGARTDPNANESVVMQAELDAWLVRGEAEATGGGNGSH